MDGSPIVRAAPTVQSRGRFSVTDAPYGYEMPGGSFTLAQFPLEYVELACEKCGRRGRLLKAKLIEAYGAEIALPDLRTIIARCDRANNTSNPCGAYYVALKADRLALGEGQAVIAG